MTRPLLDARYLPQPTSPEALAGLARRVLGDQAEGAVAWELERPGAGGPRRHGYRTGGGQLDVHASDGVAAAMALHHYLQAGLGRRACWDTPLPLRPESLPSASVVSTAVRSHAVYHLNFCTFGYTTAWWDWERWEREIDWMALHGVTMPLAAVGHEAVLHRVYTDMGLDDAEVRRFLGGPAYLPWQLMGCLDNWAGPLSADWLARRAELGARIIGRQRELGMTPVLPAFTGHVPAALATAGATTRTWWGFETNLLSPSDPLFGELTERVVHVQRELFGTSHLYASDPFIEMEPPGEDASYAADLATALVSGLRAADPDAVWVMQAWTFGYLDWWTDARMAQLLDAVDDDAMLLLDLWGEHSPQWRRFGGFRGKPWLWCTLHNFGGRNDLFGNLEAVHAECEVAQNAAEPPIGTGLSMEATDQNPVIYELVADLGQAPVEDLGAWVGDFAHRRYGVADEGAARAWAQLARGVYAAPAQRLTPGGTKSAVSRLPTFAGLGDHDTFPFAEGGGPPDAAALAGAWEDLLLVAERSPELVAAELGHDLVSVAATAMARLCDRLVVAAAEGAPGAGADLLAALDDLDLLLSLRPELRFGTWEEAAVSWGSNDTDRAMLADNARRLVTVWTTSAHPKLTDYSARLWGGLVSGLYRERWRVWVEELELARREGRAPDEATLADQIADVTEAFLAEGPTAAGSGKSGMPPRAEDPVPVLKRLLNQHRRALEAPPRHGSHEPAGQVPATASARKGADMTTPESVLSGLNERAHVSQDQVAAFARDGFIRIPSAIAPSVLEAYEPEISRQLFDLNTMHLPMEERSTYNKAFLQVTNLARHSETVRQFVLGARLGGIAADLLGVERVRLYADQALYKEPGGGITPWHADQYYWPLSSDRAVTVWIPLQDTPFELGPLEFARGSQTIDVGRELEISDQSEETVNAAMASAGLDVDREPYALGDVSYHLGWTFHRASPNRSDMARRVMTIIYVDADIRATEPQTPEHEASLEITMPGVKPGEVLDTPVNPLIPLPVQTAGNRA